MIIGNLNHLSLAGLSCLGEKYSAAPGVFVIGVIHQRGRSLAT